MQIPLDEDSQKFMVVATHVGLFKCLRMLYGVATGPGSFQRKITTLLIGIPGVAVLIDDIVITASTENEHFNRLHEVLKRLNEAGLKVNLKKCKYFKDEIKYLGYRINKLGIQPIEENIKAVRDAPRPTNISLYGVFWAHSYTIVALYRT